MNETIHGPVANAVLTLDGQPLRSADIAALGTQAAQAQVSANARSRAARSHAYEVEVSTQRQLYGRSTGVGANRNVAVADPAAHAAGLLASHATSAGPLRSDERVRATLAVRINQLAAGGSGARPELLDALLSLLKADTLPPVREYGSIGTGDLAALATVGRALPLPLGVHDVLPLLSSNAATIADAALAQHSLHNLARRALRVAAATFDSVDGNPEAYSPAAASGTPFRGARCVCDSMLSMTGGFKPARIQDPYALRALPQVHGSLLDTLARLDEVISRYAGAPAENPVLLPDVGAAHHAGFHAAYLAQALDAAVSAIAQAAQLSVARLALLVEPDYTGLTPFLGNGRPGASGVMLSEYVAASALAALRALATPTSAQSLVLSRGAEEDASFAALAARQALDTVEPLRIVLACELVAATRALRMRQRPVPARFEVLPDNTKDRDLTDDIELAALLI